MIRSFWQRASAGGCETVEGRPQYRGAYEPQLRQLKAHFPDAWDFDLLPFLKSQNGKVRLLDKIYRCIHGIMIPEEIPHCGSVHMHQLRVHFPDARDFDLLPFLKSQNGKVRLLDKIYRCIRGIMIPEKSPLRICAHAPAESALPRCSRLRPPPVPHEPERKGALVK
jgi:hypothetical protein